MDFKQQFEQLKVLYNKVPQMKISISMRENDYSAKTLSGYLKLYNSMGHNKT